MLTFSLDEYGDFEGIKQDNEPIYIAGLIYDDRQSQDTRIERKRIKAYYQSVISDAATDATGDTADFQYPQALHSNGDRERDNKVVRLVKELVRKTMPEFIKTGTYKGNKLTWIDQENKVRQFYDRQGEYHIFVILKSDEGMKKLLGNHANILAKDDYASNLYFHMADELVSRLIFYNPVIDHVDDVSFNIATRTSANLPQNDPLAAQYRKQGYKQNKCNEKDPNSKVYFSLTNADVYRSIISEEILDAECPNFQISDFRVTSIGYWENAKNMEFLYMADSICSILGFRMEGENSDEWLRCILGRTENLTGKRENLIFGYDEIDNIYKKAWNKYTEGDFLSALSITFDACQKEGAFADYYKKVWFKKLEDRIASSKSVSAFRAAVSKLSGKLYDNTLNTAKCLYVLTVLEKMVPQIEPLLDSPESKRILYQLYDIGVTSYTHIGDSKNAEKHFEKCFAHARNISLEEYLLTRNKMAVFYCDYFNLDQAERIADENICYQELLADLKREIEIPGALEGAITSLGIAYSQRAQVYAFKGMAEAEDEFRKALEKYEPQSANYKITQSYLLHYYLDAGMKEEYILEAKDYFGGESNLQEQLSYLIREGAKEDPIINMKYALYIFVKALYKFRLEEVSNRLWERVKNIEALFGERSHKSNYRLTDHPSEIIFKYMRLIAIARQDTELESYYADRMSTCLLYQGATEKAIIQYGEIEVANTKGDLVLRNELINELCAFMKKNFDAFEEVTIPEEIEARFEWLNETIIYMYR